MKAAIDRGPFQVVVEERADPQIQDLLDAVVRITTTNICGSDLHMYEGRTSVEEGTILGHENMGVVAIGVVAIGVVGRAGPSFSVSHEPTLEEAPAGYEKFDKRADGCTKILLHPAA